MSDEAAVRRRSLALAVLIGVCGVSAVLRALPHSLPPPRAPEASCAAARVEPGQPANTPLRLRCDGAGEALPGRAGLLLGVRINVNEASALDLAALPGIGERMAQRILEDRTRRGRFARVDELSRVKGIGPKTVGKLRAFVRVD